LEFSVIICTYNRAKVLAECLATLAEQTLSPDRYEVLVVDNHSTDDTAMVAASFAHCWSHFQCVSEADKYLSKARNTGTLHASGFHLVFLDDDVLLPPGYLDRVAYVRDHFAFPCWGGIDIPWYAHGKPLWVQDAYLQFRLPYEQVTQVNAARKECVTGFSFIIRRDLLLASGGFDPRVGMKGDVVGYGEETYLQHQLHARGIPVGYDPELILRHHMLPHKLKLRWYFEASVALGKSQAVFRRNMTWGPRILLILKTFCEIWLVTALDLVRSTWKWVIYKDFFWQNWLIESFRKIGKRVRFIRDLMLGSRA